MPAPPDGEIAMVWLWLILGFALFMALLGSVYVVNRAAAQRFGYEPFSLPNAALMLVVNLLVLSALGPAAETPADAASAELQQMVMLAAAAVLAGSLLVLIARRSSLWYALYAVALMSVGAVAVLPSLLFMRLARATPDVGPPPSDDPSGHDS